MGDCARLWLNFLGSRNDYTLNNSDCGKMAADRPRLQTIIEGRFAIVICERLAVPIQRQRERKPSRFYLATV
jgi:hypothetical protein